MPPNIRQVQYVIDGWEGKEAEKEEGEGDIK
jgi:hypothetical protein